MKAQQSSIVCESPKSKSASAMGITQEESDFMHEIFQRAKPLKARSTTRIARANRRRLTLR